MYGKHDIYYITQVSQGCFITAWKYAQRLPLLCQIVYEKGMAAIFKLPSILVANVALLWSL